MPANLDRYPDLGLGGGQARQLPHPGTLDQAERALITQQRPGPGGQDRALLG
jgi:hypothetical protein